MCSSDLKTVDGFQGLYIADQRTGVERLLIGGPGAGPLGYLRGASLTLALDTLDTFTSEPGGGSPFQRGSGAYVVHTIRFARGGRWEIVDTWYDSAGHETARQSTLTAQRRLMTELETVRANVDSASMLVSRDHVTAWVVPAGKNPELYDGAAAGERYTFAAVISAVAQTGGAIGRTFRYPAYSLYGGAPVATRVDSIRIVARDTLYRGATPLAVVVLQRSNGGLVWADETTGSEVASRGNAGPGRWWWHIRRGISPLASPFSSDKH